VECAEHGVVVEHIPWSDGKRPVTCAMMGFLARWARRLSWRETARAFQTSWEAVYRSVEWFVQWGLAHRELRGVESIGVDEIHWGRGLKADNFLTVIYQIDRHCRRLLWVGRRRSQATLRRGLKALGPKVVKGLEVQIRDLGGGFLDYWCFRAMRSRLEPMKRVARMLRAHEPLILNWFRAKGEISNGAVEGLNNEIRVVTRRSYGFRTYEAMEIALYHNLGRLPEQNQPTDSAEEASNL
jgi:transposase